MSRFLGIAVVLALIAGCNDTSKPAPIAPDSAAEKIKLNLAKLSPEDRAIAEQQKFCAVETDNRLGSMGVPIKVMVKGEPVFLCCKGCNEEATKDPEKTLAAVKRLKEQK